MTSCIYFGLINILLDHTIENRCVGSCVVYDSSHSSVRLKTMVDLHMSKVTYDTQYHVNTSKTMISRVVYQEYESFSSLQWLAHLKDNIWHAKLHQHEQ